MQLTERIVGGVTVLSVRGDLDAASAPALDERIRSLAEAGRPRVLLDLSGVGYISSAGLRALVAGLRAAQTAGGEMPLAGAGTSVREILDLTGFSGLFVLFPDVESGLRAIEAAAGETQIDGVTVITFDHDLDAAAAPAVRERLQVLVAAGRKKLVVDLSRVHFISSAGLRALVSGLWAVREVGGDLRLVHAGPAVREAVGLTGLQDILRLYDDLDSARRDF